MAADLAAFRAQFPELSAHEDAEVNRALAVAKLIHEVREMATLYCAAHLLSAAAVGGDGEGAAQLGEIASEGAGPLRTTYVTQATPGQKHTFFTSTSYGQTFLQLERRAPRTAIGAMVVGP